MTEPHSGAEVGASSEPSAGDCMPAAAAPVGTVLVTNVPTRLDRLLWSPWHWTVVIALGITWTLDGLEASLISNVGSVLTKPDTLGITGAQLGFANAAYLVGQIVGALYFGRLTDKYGRKKLFLVTLGVYLIGTALSGLALDFYSFLACRFIAGAGIGGEVSAINSAIDELIPARNRGAVDLGINGSYWVGAGLGAMLTVVLLNEEFLPHKYGWRLIFALGATLGICIALVRKFVPESPRWLLMRGREAEAKEIVDHIETEVRKRRPDAVPSGEAPKVNVKVTGSVSFSYVAHTVFGKHLRRSILGTSLMVTQAFLYNAIFFSYALILTQFYQVPAGNVGYYMVPFAVGNFLGPVLLGPLFDTIGRRVMIAGTYGLSAILLAITGYMFQQGWLDATTQTACWCVIFFFASAAASSGYLTVSELFPVELRGMAIALFFMIGQGAGAIAAPVFSALAANNSRDELFVAYLFASGLMMLGAIVAATLGINAEGKSLEELAEHDPQKT
jgi:MFS family permease